MDQYFRMWDEICVGCGFGAWAAYCVAAAGVMPIRGKSRRVTYPNG